MVKPVVDQIYSADGTKTFDTLLSELSESVSQKSSTEKFTELETKSNNLITDAPEAYDTLKEISQYISSHNDEYTGCISWK